MNIMQQEVIEKDVTKIIKKKKKRERIGKQVAMTTNLLTIVEKIAWRALEK